ncbi:MAG: hypothetical protein WCW16_03420 [Candidatus Magasanikbacteria bacterium]
MAKKKLYPKKHIIMVFYGVSGSGKSLLLGMIKSIFDHVTLHRKDCTRPARKGEPQNGPPELRLVKRLVPKKNYLFIYKQYGYWYGIRKDQLNDAFENHQIHLLIIGNMNALKKFKSLYPHAITVYVHSDPENIPQRLLVRDTLEYQKRKKRIVELYKDFLSNSLLFDFIILNFWDKKNALKQARNIIIKYLERTNRLIHL